MIRRWLRPDLWHRGSTLWYFLPRVVGVGLPLVTLPVITRVLRPEEYGDWVLAAVFGAFVSGLGNFGLPLAFDRNFFEFEEPRENAALLWGVVGVVTGLLGTLIGLVWIFQDALAATVLRIPGRGLLVAWTTTALCVASVKHYFLLYFRNVDDARSYALFSIDESVLSAVFVVGFVWFLDVGPVGLAWGPLLASVAVLLLLLARMVRQVPPAFALGPVAASVRLSLPLFPKILLGVVGTQFDKWVVGVLGGSAPAAQYAIGQRLANVVFVVATALENKFQPATYRLMFDGADDAGFRIGRLLTPFAYLVAGCGLVVTVFATEAVALLATPEYAGAALVCNILVLHYALTFFGKQPQLMFAKRTGLISMFSASSVAVTVLITGYAASVGGALGAAIGTLISGVLTTGVFVWISQRSFTIEYETSSLAAYYGALGIASAAMLGLAMGAPPLPVFLAAKGIFVAGYFWLGRRDRVFDRFRAVARPAPTARS
ncbi:MAG: lipopolysaccharide biosynthesis protein [Longimicrobiales bacterium]